ncbi:alpha/beta hydrolase [Shimia sp. FJ5]|uniref:alpha/beta hydrolase n=1 Tax=Shimia sp. FJ5 TaxID=3079054 RepID=UPI0026387574|nr:alpha/beta fold hydrolase [Shimia sp. FJ5]MDV4145430.1 alpha/beta fold hydrolase [Shimia sp. FJ5]
MRTFGRFLGRMLLLVGLLLGGLWFFGPRETVTLVPEFDTAAIGPDVDAYLAAREAGYSGLTPGVEKRVVWAGTTGEATDQAIVYVHGFSATSEEIRPVPDLVAAELGANLVYTRLAGHGLGGAALAEARASEWMSDVAEAIAVAHKIGNDVIIIATSTGATLVAEAALQPEMMQGVAGIILVSPNFAIADPASVVLTLPAARFWVPTVAGQTRSWEPGNEGHATYWTHSYPTQALFQMAALVKHARGQDYGAVTIPALFRFSDADQVVDHRATRAVVDAWGGPVTVQAVQMTEGDDPSSHVIAGDIMSPGQTQDAVTAFVNWINAL